MLWNSVEWKEKRRDAQLARTLELALPTELTHDQNIALIRKFVQETFVDKGMCADVAFHDKGDGNRIPAKQKGRWKTHKENTVDWDDRGKAEIWRAAAAHAINDALREVGFTQGFVDHHSYARQGKVRIPMIHEGPQVRAMEQRGILTEASQRNREIRGQLAQLARLNAWAQYEKKMDEALIARGQDVSNPYPRYVLASRIIFEATVPPSRKDRRLKDAAGLMSIMKSGHITDAASYAEAVKRANAQFYALHSRWKENAELSCTIGARITAYEDKKKYRRHYDTWSRLSGSRTNAYEREHAFELQGHRENIRRLEVVKRDFIRERTRSLMEQDRS